MEKTAQLFIFLVAIWISSKVESNVSIDESEFSKIILIDTFSNLLQSDTAHHLTTADFHPIYIGKERDTLLLSYDLREIKYRVFERAEYYVPDSLDLEIFIDTTKLIGAVNNLGIPPPPPPVWYKPYTEPICHLHRKPILSYPVYIKNLYHDTVSIGLGNRIPMIIEAKDSLGIWRNIQMPYKYYCGTGLFNLYIPPSNILLTNCKLYEGDYRTTMRLVYLGRKEIYSNEFVATMNYGQFQPSNSIKL